MATESEENISYTLTEINLIKNHINNSRKSKEFMFDKFNEAFSMLTCKGEMPAQINPQDNFGFYYPKRNALSKYFADESDYNETNNLATFFIEHEGNSEQFATGLSSLFIGDKHIKCYPMKIKLTSKNNNELVENYSFANFVQFFDDYGTLLHSGFVDVFNNIKLTHSLQDLLNELKQKETTNDNICTLAEIEGVNYYEDNLDLARNFTIFQTLTDQGGVQFNFDAYEFDFHNAEFENCQNLQNYISKRELKQHLSSYISSQKTFA